MIAVQWDCLEESMGERGVSAGSVEVGCVGRRVKRLLGAHVDVTRPVVVTGRAWRAGRRTGHASHLEYKTFSV